MGQGSSDSPKPLTWACWLARRPGLIFGKYIPQKIAQGVGVVGWASGDNVGADTGR